MTDIEKDVERRLVEAVKAAGGRCLKWVSPGSAGVPDRICMFPGGRLVFVELKRPEGGVIAPRQRYWADVLQRLGFRVELISTKADADALAVHYKYNDVAAVDYIGEHLSTAELWGQLAEEAAELAQAALKMQRLQLDNNKPRKTAAECIDGLNEELADVFLCLEVLGVADPAAWAEIRERKLRRWVGCIGNKSEDKT